MLLVSVVCAFGALGTKIARIRVSQSISQRTSVPPASDQPGCRLHDYMQLPASQYESIPLPLGATLVRVTGEMDLFTLRVPPLRFAIPRLPVVEVCPEVLARVVTLPDRVVIASEACRVSGSPLIDSLQLNERFNFSVRTCFTWRPDASAAGSSDATIHSQTDLAVDVDPPGPFAILPRRLLEPVGTSAMELALSSLHATFVTNLGTDYERWASNESYRIMRAQGNGR
jgi:hypothetical protein